MTQLNLFFGLIDSITHLFELGADSTITYETRLLIDSLVADFEESGGIEIEEYESIGLEVDQSPLTAIIAKIATKERTIPQELKEYFLVEEYFHVVENPQLENEIFFRGLPSLPEPRTPEEAKLRLEIFVILNDLLQVGVNSCSVHEARMQINAILETHEQIQAEMEGYRRIGDSDHVFPNLDSELNALTTFSKSEVEINAII